jgi:Flp pilus assembly protein TadG
MLKKLKSTRGSQVVEFALMLPLLLILVFGIIDFGMAIFDKAVITNSSREGARVGVVYRYPQPTATELQTIVTNTVTSYCATNLITFGGPTTPTVTVSGGASSGTDLTVTVDYTYNYLAISNLIGVAPIAMRSTTVMRME